MVQNPGLIVKGMESMGEREDSGLEKRIVQAERELGRIQKEEDRAIGLYVSGKISEDQLDHQRRLIHERLEAARARLDEYRSQGAAAVERKVLTGNVAEWSRRIGEGLDDLPVEDRREVLRLIVDQIAIDGDNSVTITLGIPTQGLVSVGEEGSRRG